jgi:hypothetical protein
MIEISSSAEGKIDSASAPYLGRWHRLVSTTNWEKGRIIQEWRTALSSAGAPASEYADDAWSSRVGNVTGQHVGRLRRVYERFGNAASDYHGLFWSHFQSALDWDDAEMWLEGAVQSRWSVAEMRRQRLTTRAAAEGKTPDDAETGSDSPDEDFEPLDDEPTRQSTSAGVVAERAAGKSEVADRTAEASEETNADEWFDDASAAGTEHREVARPAPFAHLAELPEDLADAFESFKLAIVRHRLV